MYVRVLFRFAWGRSRLPSATGVWTSKHKLSRRSGSEKQLPISHTCFFSVELPVYSTEEAMRWGLTTAITFGMSTCASLFLDTYCDNSARKKDRRCRKRATRAA